MKRVRRLVLLLIAALWAALWVAPGFAASATTNPRELVFVEGTDVVPLDPQFVHATPTFGVVRLINEGLVDLDPSMQIVPRLARTYEVSEDGKTWTFALRPGVKFSNGSPLTAHAVKFTFDRVLAAETASPYRSVLLGVDRIETPDDLTVRIATKTPNPEFLLNLAAPSMTILSPEATSKYSVKDYGRYPVGTGPYMLAEWTPGDRVVLVPNPHYWGGRPKLDRIIYRPVPEASVRAAMLRTGEADIVVKLQPEDLKPLEADPNIVVRTFNTMYQISFELNVDKGPLRDKRVRQALNHAVDKVSIVKNVLRGMGEPMVSPLGPGIAYRATFPPYAYDPARARQLLIEAGHPNGFPMTLWAPNGRYLKDREVAEAVQNYFRAVGVQAELRLWEWGAYLPATIKDSNREAVMLGRATPGTDYTVTRLFSKSAVGVESATNFWHPELEVLLPQARSTFDPKKRADLYRRIQQVVWEEAPWIFLHNQRQIVGLRKNVDGFAMQTHEIMLLENVSKR